LLLDDVEDHFGASEMSRTAILSSAVLYAHCVEGRERTRVSQRSNPATVKWYGRGTRAQDDMLELFRRLGTRKQRRRRQGHSWHARVGRTKRQE